MSRARDLSHMTLTIIFLGLELEFDHSVLLIEKSLPEAVALAQGMS